MTEHVRGTYRSHRKAAWAVVLALAGLLAAIAIPLAIGGTGKTYTLTASPTATCASPAQTTVTIKNTGSPQTMGSAEIYFPSNKVDTTNAGTLLPDSTSSAQPQKKDIIRLDGLNLAPTKSKSILVTFKPGVTFNTQVTAVVKQSNRFNDSSGSANLFSLEGSFPTVKIVTCVTVTGKVYLDRSQAPSFATGAGTYNDVFKPWTVNLYEKQAGGSWGTPIKTTTASSSLITDALGTYTYKFTGVPTGSDYRLCVAATGGDASTAWAVTVPSVDAGCPAVSASSNPPPTSPGLPLTGLSADASGQDFAVAPVTAPFGANDTSAIDGGNYSVTGGSGTTKADQRYVQETWTEGGTVNFKFTPISGDPCASTSGASRIYLLETLKGDIPVSALNAGKNQVSLDYDDCPPYDQDDLVVMPYCLVDPGPATSLATTGVLPPGATSCIVSSSQEVRAGGNVHFEYHVYTAFDGGRTAH